MPALANLRHEQFAVYVACERLSATEAYIKAGYTGGKGAEASASRLLKTVKVAARIRELAEEIAAAALTVSIADQNYRLAAMDRRHKLIEQIIRERAAEMTKGGKPIVAGAGTGMLVKTIKAIGSGKNFRVGFEYQFDAALFREMRAIEEAAAVEVGPPARSEKDEHFLMDLAEQVEDGPAPTPGDESGV